MSAIRNPLKRFRITYAQFHDSFATDARVVSAVNFEQTRCAHAATNTHGDNTPFGFTACAFHEDCAGATRAGHAERMADRDRAAIDVLLLRVDAERYRGNRGTGWQRLR